MMKEACMTAYAISITASTSQIFLSIRSLPEIDGLSKETVLTSWMAKFDCILKGTGKSM